MKAELHIEYDDGKMKINGTVDGITVHHKTDLGIQQEMVERQAQMLFDQTPEHARHPAGSSDCKICNPSNLHKL